MSPNDKPWEKAARECSQSNSFMNATQILFARIIERACREYAEGVMKERDEVVAAEHRLSDAYLRIREKLGAWDTPTAPTVEQVWAVTEGKLDDALDDLTRLRAENERLKDRLLVIDAHLALSVEVDRGQLRRGIAEVMGKAK